MWYNISVTVNTGVEKKREGKQHEEKDYQHFGKFGKNSQQPVT